MDRQIVYPGSIPLDTDILSVQRNTMLALGFLAQATLGSNTVVDGLACTPQLVPNMTFNVGPGSILSLSNVDANAFGSLAADTTDALVKMGINLGTTVFTVTAPGTTGQSRNYLIQAAFQEADASAVVLPYYNSSNPAVAYSGPANSGAAQNTQRLQSVNLQMKTGVAATTGTQVTPTPDGGFVGLWVITVAYAQTSVTAGNIARLGTAPFVDGPVTGRGVQPGRLLGTQTFSTAGTSTYIPTQGTNSVEAEVIGGGAAGGGSAATGAAQVSGGAGGGGGGYARKRITSAFSGVTVTVGAGGVGGVGTAGGAGGASSFGALVTATGGSGGSLGAAATANGFPQGGAQGGTGTGGDVNAKGGLGMYALYFATVSGGAGGSSFLGSGALWVTGTNNGNAATTPGAGGSGGAQSLASSSANAGGAGAPGIVIVREYS